jgi:hypothetical protein
LPLLLLTDCYNSPHYRPKRSQEAIEKPQPNHNDSKSPNKRLEKNWEITQKIKESYTVAIYVIVFGFEQREKAYENSQ